MCVFERKREKQSERKREKEPEPSFKSVIERQRQGCAININRK